jgi:hypothetical protein
MLNASALNSTPINGPDNSAIMMKAIVRAKIGIIAAASLSLSAAASGQMALKTEARPGLLIEAASQGQSQLKIKAHQNIKASCQAADKAAFAAKSASSLKLSNYASTAYTYNASATCELMSWRVREIIKFNCLAAASLSLSGSAVPQAFKFSSLSEPKVNKNAAVWKSASTLKINANPLITRWSSADLQAVFKGTAKPFLTLHSGSNFMFSFAFCTDGDIRRNLFGWKEGVGYRVIQDTSINGLKQGGIKRDALMGALQRMGL